MGWELETVEKQFVEQLVAMGWLHVEGDLDAPAFTWDVPRSVRMMLS